MKTYTYYSRFSQTKESYYSVIAMSRLRAAKHFAERKKLTLRDFLHLYEVSR